MTDVTQGADAPDENALFNEAVAADTLEKFENPPPVKEPEKPAAPAAPEVKPEAKADAKPDDSAPVPPGRLREEAEARRRAERERDDLRAQMAMLARQQPQQQQPQQPQRVDLFENPSGFVQQELRPYLETIQSQFQMQREAMSLDFALQRHGEERVGSARQALEQGMARGDPHAWGTYQRAMSSHDPYGVIVKWHQDGETLRNVGGDLDAYRKRILEEALADPEYRARAIEAAKGEAATNGAHVARPAVVKPAVASPSLGNIGASGGDAQIVEPSDAELFRAATQAKRR